VAPDGKSIDSTPFQISSGLSAEFRPSIAWNGREFVAAWLSVFQARVTATRIADGSTLGDMIIIADANARPTDVHVTPIGSTWLVAWNEVGTVRARFLDDGAVPFTVTPTAIPASRTFIASNGKTVLAAYQRTTPESTNVPRLFYRWISADRARAVRR